MITFIDKENYRKNAETNMGRHWEKWEHRWKYFQRSIDIIKEYTNIDDPKKVVEVGTMGACLVNGCDTIDYSERWSFKGKNPTYLHDIRKFPWPIKDKKYDLFIALRVWQHLSTFQKDCFLEAKRISKELLIVVPVNYKNGFGVTPNQVIEWNNQKEPTHLKVEGNLLFIYNKE